MAFDIFLRRQVARIEGSLNPARTRRRKRIINAKDGDVTTIHFISRK